MKLWATAWGAFDALLQFSAALFIASFVHTVFELDRLGAVLSFAGAVFFVMWVHAAVVLYAQNTPVSK